MSLNDLRLESYYYSEGQESIVASVRKLESTLEEVDQKFREYIL